MSRVREAYDANAELYASLFLDELDRDDRARRWLAAFADLGAGRPGPIVDLGCGLGSVVHHLRQLGLETIGIDLSAGQIGQARRAFPDLAFQVGDLTALPFADSSLGGVVSRYSLIHVPPSDLDEVFVEWTRALGPGAPLLVSFFGSRSADAHGAPFDHRVVTAHELFPAMVGRQLRDAGLTVVEVEAVPIPPGGRPLDQATILARKPHP